MTKNTKPRLEMLIYGVAAALCAGAVFHESGWSVVTAPYYLLSLALAVTAIRSVFQIPDAVEPLTPRHRMLNGALGLGLSLVVYYGALLLMFTGPA